MASTLTNTNKHENMDVNKDKMNKRFIALTVLIKMLGLNKDELLDYFGKPHKD